MSVQIFSSGMHHNVNTEFQRALQVGRHERVVANDARSRRVRQIRDGLKVCNDHHGVRRRLDEYHARVLLDGGLNVRDVGSVNEIKLNVVVRQYARE